MPVSAPAPSSSSSTAAWNAVALPSPRCAAQIETAVPSSISRCGPITPPAPQPTSWLGHQRLVDGLEQRLGRRRGACRRRTRSRGRSVSPPSARARRGARLERRLARVAGGGEACADPDGHPPPTILRAMPGPTDASSRSSGRPGIGKTAVAIALAERLRAGGRGPGRRLGRRAAALRGPGDPHGAPTAAERERLEHRLRRHAAAHRDLQRRRVRARRARGDRRAARPGQAPDRRRRHRPVPARRARRARPAPARRRPRSATRRRAQLETPRRAGAARASSPSARPRPPPRSARRTPSASPARSSCSTRARRRRPARRPRSCGRPRCAARRCWPASRWTARRSSRRIEARVDAMVAAGAERGGPRRGGRRRVARRPPGARLRGSCSTATSRR